MFTAALIAFSGCNINSNLNNPSQSTIPDYSDQTSQSETTSTINTTVESSSVTTTSLPEETTSLTSETTATEATTTTSKLVTAATTAAVTTAPVATQKPKPVTQKPEPVVTDPPVVTTAPAPVPAEPSEPIIYATTADGVLIFSNGLSVIDYSNTDDGYVMVKYTGNCGTVKVQVQNPSGVKQTYTINTQGRYEALPLTDGNGTYTIAVCEKVSDKGYAVVNSGSVDVALSNALAPFLRPSNYVPFSYGDSAVTKSSYLCGGTSTNLEKVDKVYSWLVDNVTYDSSLASSKIPGGYVPDTEKVINKKIGICLDYAGTMAAMLRSQGIPVQLVVGHAGTANHAWVNVYDTDVGWVYGAIYFDGSAWHRMDPTYAAGSHSSDDILKYIGNGSNYNPDLYY